MIYIMIYTQTDYVHLYLILLYYVFDVTDTLNIGT